MTLKAQAGKYTQLSRLVTRALHKLTKEDCLGPKSGWQYVKFPYLRVLCSINASKKLWVTRDWGENFRLFSFSNTQGLYGFHLIKWKAYKEKEVEWGFKIYILQGLITGRGNRGWSGSEQVGQGFNSHPEGKVCIWVVCSNNSLALEFNTRYSSKIKSKPHSARQQAQGGTWLYDRHTWKAGERK